VGDGYHLVHIGGGLSTTCVLAALGQALLEGRQDHSGANRLLLQITVIDKNGDFGGGLAYGRHTSPVYLLQDSVKTIDSASLPFRRWLSRHGSRVLAGLAGADARLDRWLETHRDTLSRAAYDDLHLPRLVFGAFARDLFWESVCLIEGHGLASVVCRTADVLSLRPSPGGAYLLQTDRDATPIGADRVVLALGSPPAHRETPQGPRRGYLRDLYSRSLDEVESEILHALGGVAPDRRSIVMQGANAAAAEILYCIAGRRELRQAVGEIVVVSPHGRLPDGRPSGLPLPYRCEHLLSLAHGTGLCAAALFEAARADIREALGRGYSVVDVMETVRRHFNAAFDRLGAAEKKEFVDHYGERYRSLLRWTSPDYGRAMASLRREGRLQVVRGWVEQTERWEPIYRVTVVGPDGARMAVTAPVVIDCMGQQQLATSANPLIRGMLDGSLAQVTPSGHGLVVDSAFEAAPRLHVMGPLLAGMSGGADHLWRLESIPRIADLAARLGRLLAQQIAPATASIDGTLSGTAA
jgi:uncharacterized NAD(P)/FAD-binding protein YdhS